jgi:S1-C subfamily serine protease
LGTGVFFTDTKLVTNAHVVGYLPETKEKFRKVYSDEDLARVIFRVVFGGKKYRAQFVGRDPDVDLAILEVEHPIPGIKIALLGDSDETAVGDRVIACGNPYGMENTITEGIISAKEKKTGLLSYEDYIQTDAAINPGNSGGPLVSLKTASVIGIVNSGIPQANNMGYAIPINLFKSIQDELKGTLRHAWIGVNFPLQDMKDAEGFSGLLTIYNYTAIDEIVVLISIQKEIFEAGGVLVTDVMRTLEEQSYDLSYEQIGGRGDFKTPAYRANLQIADVIKQFGFYEIKTSKDLIYAIFRSTPYQETTIRVVRFSKTNEREEKEITLTPIVRIPVSARGEFY